MDNHFVQQQQQQVPPVKRPSLKFTRVFSDLHGDTHFEEMEVPTTSDGEIGFLSANIPVKDLIFREVVPDYDYDFHVAPQKQYLVMLEGVFEIETSLGAKRQFKAGDVILLEDTTGKGHKSRNVTKTWRKTLFITVP